MYENYSARRDKPKSPAAAGHNETERSSDYLHSARLGRDLEALPAKEHTMGGELGRKMRERLGVDMTGVKIYEDSGLKENFGKSGYARGNEIHVSEGLYSPETAGGLDILMHEAGHVVQQGSGMVHGHGEVDSDALESQADSIEAPRRFSMPSVSSMSAVQWYRPRNQRFDVRAASSQRDASDLSYGGFKGKFRKVKKGADYLTAAGKFGGAMTKGISGMEKDPSDVLKRNVTGGITSIAGTIGSTFDLINSGISVHDARAKGDALGRLTGGFDIARNIFDLGKNGTQIASSFTNEKAGFTEFMGKAGPWLGIASGLFKTITGSIKVGRINSMRSKLEERAKAVEARRDSQNNRELTDDEYDEMRAAKQARAALLAKRATGTGEIAGGLIAMGSAGLSLLGKLLGGPAEGALTSISALADIGNIVPGFAAKDNARESMQEYRDEIVDEELELPQKIAAYKQAHRNVTDAQALRAVLVSLGYASGTRREAFMNITMSRAKRLMDKANRELNAPADRPRPTIAFLEDMGITTSVNGGYSLQGIAERLGMDENVPWEKQMAEFSSAAVNQPVNDEGESEDSQRSIRDSAPDHSAPDSDEESVIDDEGSSDEEEDLVPAVVNEEDNEEGVPQAPVVKEQHDEPEKPADGIVSDSDPAAADENDDENAILPTMTRGFFVDGSGNMFYDPKLYAEKYAEEGEEEDPLDETALTDDEKRALAAWRAARK